MVKVSIIILAFNGINLTLEVLKDISELKIKGLEVETIVVDNASKDDTAEHLRKYHLPNMPFRLIENKINLGFAGGNNVGINMALKGKSDYILLLNNDVILDPGLLNELVKTAAKDEKIGMVAPKIYFAKSKVIWYAGGLLDTKNVYGNHRGVDEVDLGQYDMEEETDFATGACVLIKAQALKKVGYLKDNYFLYWEDVELSQRMKLANWKIVYTPKAYLWHRVSVAAGGSGGGANDYFLSRNRLAFGMQYSGFRTKTALLKDSVRILFKGRPWQKKGVADFYLGRMGKGSWKN